MKAIGETHGLLRVVHLNAHLEAAEVLRPERIRHYVVLRGFADHGGRTAVRGSDRNGRR